MKRVYMLCRDGIVRTWRRNPLVDLVWKVKAGWFTLRGGRCHIAPTKYVLKSYRSPITLLLLESTELALAYREGEPEPVTLFSEREESSPHAARARENVPKAACLRSLLPQPIPWVLILVIVAVVAVLGVVGAAALVRIRTPMRCSGRRWHAS